MKDLNRYIVHTSGQIMTHHYKPINDVSFFFENTLVNVYGDTYHGSLFCE